jgi:hypothetical protein
MGLQTSYRQQTKSRRIDRSRSERSRPKVLLISITINHNLGVWEIYDMSIKGIVNYEKDGAYVVDSPLIGMARKHIELINIINRYAKQSGYTSVELSRMFD